jgi:thermostable 8-oxoguanine DNA glycosylase
MKIMVGSPIHRPLDFKVFEASCTFEVIKLTLSFCILATDLRFFADGFSSLTVEGFLCDAVIILFEATLLFSSFKSP